ncbi:DUF4139 domain-containing protein [Thermaurantimonas aggregans]|uniref:DUF4139 domain-containing protein n=1 Tax=Thermaurantimonas aggregans TaxID=2173829 RepID=UPI0023F5405E|nr:DUF4139 domain-containing protein [Thermaurantimonas aggregans]MCX8147986.1 DUF4139 domain-containing protein [Thermaurantimonas aggregans]
MNFKNALSIFGLFVAMSFFLNGQNALNVAVTEAEVYSNGYAQLYLQHETTLKKGVNAVTILLPGREIQQQTLAVEIMPFGKIARISEPMELTCNEDDSCRYYTEQVKLFREKILAKSLELEKLDAQEKLLMENSRITNSNNLNMQLLRDALSFLQKQLVEIKEARLKTKHQLDEFQKEYQTLQNQLNQRTNYIKQSFRKVSVLVDVKTDGLYKLNFSYVSSGVRWNRQQEIDIAEAEEKAYLKNLAQVHSDFQETWRNIKLTLIDKAFEFSEKPLQIRPLRVVFHHRIITSSDRSESSSRYMAKVLTPTAVQGAFSPEDVVDVQTNKQQRMDGEIFILTGAYTLSSTKPLQAELSTDTLSIKLHFLVAPYIVNKVQVLGIVRERTEDISETPSVVRLNGRPVGINTAPVLYSSDSAAFQLGYLKDVTIQRKRENPYSSRSFFGNTQRDSFEYTISIANRRSTPISLTIIDRVPVSTDSQIDVKFKKADGVQPDRNGILRWSISVPPGRQNSVSFAFEISYPKGRTVTFIEGNED